MSALLTNEIKGMIGREVKYTANEEIGRASIRYFALAIGDDNPLYTSDDFARAHGYPSVIAPPTFVCESNQYMNQKPDVMGSIGHRWRLPIEGCRELRGGHEYEFHRPVLPSDRITVTWRIVDVQERTSSRGNSLLVLQSEASYTNSDGDLLAVNRETIIYQPVDASP